jgi:hypothetical protein
VSEDKREHAKPAVAGAKPATPPAAQAKPGTAAPGASGNPAKSEQIRRDRDRDEDKPGGSTPTQSERALLRLGRALTALAFVILLFVIVGAVLLFRQQLLIGGQLEQMQIVAKQTEQSLTMAGRIADAAKKSADTMTDIERAYLLLDSSASILPKTVASGTPMRLAFKNYGKTPATLHAVSGRYFYSPGPPARLAAPQTGMAVPLVVTDGGAAGPYDIPLDINDSDLARATRGDGAVVAQAVLVYADVMGETHQTDVCFTFQFKTGQFETCAAVGLDSHN